MMTKIVKGYWNEKKEKIKKKYPFLSERDLNFNEGKEREMIEILAYKLGKTEMEFLDIIVSI